MALPKWFWSAIIAIFCVQAGNGAQHVQSMHYGELAVLKIEGISVCKESKIKDARFGDVMIDGGCLPCNGGSGVLIENCGYNSSGWFVRFKATANDHGPLSRFPKDTSDASGENICEDWMQKCQPKSSASAK
eukprot:246216_1